MRQGKLEVTTGRTQVGKTTYVDCQTKGDPLILLHDPKGHPRDYKNYHRVDNAADFFKAWRKGVKKIRLVNTDPKVFDYFCKVALKAGQMGQSITVIADELSDVTGPGKAPDGWGQLCRKGIGFGIKIYAITQRPAESDKTCFANATHLTALHVNRLQDRKYMADEMDIERVMIDKLKPFEAVTKDNNSQKINKIKISSKGVRKAA